MDKLHLECPDVTNRTKNHMYDPWTRIFGRNSLRVHFLLEHQAKLP